jgi:hypothetical protein
MANRFKEKLQGSGREILNSGKLNIEENNLKSNEDKNKIKGIGNNESNTKLDNYSNIPNYILSDEYLMWKMAKPDKSPKGSKYQINITVSEETLKKQMALEYKLGLNRHKMSELPNKAMDILYDIVYILDNESDILDLSTEQILNLVSSNIKAKFPSS